MKKITSKLHKLHKPAHCAHMCKVQSARTAQSPIGFVQCVQGNVRSTPSTRRKIQVVKECNPALSDHDVELMRVMHEEYPRGHPEHIGYRKLCKIFGTSYTYTANICRYRRRVAGL